MAGTTEVLAGARCVFSLCVALLSAACCGIEFLLRVLSASLLLVASPSPATAATIKMRQSSRELEAALRSMLPCFEGAESEQNWKQRERSIRELRKLTQSAAPRDSPAQFAATIKSLLDGIVKTIKSLRTTLSADGCNLVKELAKVLGPTFDPMVIDILIPALVGLCASTKALARANGEDTVKAILKYVPINPRILHYITDASKDKNYGPRISAAVWLQAIIQKNGHLCEHGGGLDHIDRCIRLGLSDAKPEVRERMRDTYWIFARVWPGRAESIMAQLDPKARKLLENNSNNPNHDSLATATEPDKPVAVSATTTKSSSRTAFQEAIAAKRRAAKAALTEPESTAAHGILNPVSMLTTKTTHGPDMIENLPPSKSAPIRPVSSLSSKNSHIELKEELPSSKNTNSAPTRPGMRDLIAQKRAIKVTSKVQQTAEQEIARPSSSLSTSASTQIKEQAEDLPFSRSTTSVPTRSSVKDATYQKRAQKVAVPEASGSTRQDMSRSQKAANAEVVFSAKQDTSRPNSSHETSTGLLSSAPVRRPRGLPPTLRSRSERPLPAPEPESESEVAVSAVPTDVTSSDPHQSVKTDRQTKIRRIHDINLSPPTVPRVPLPSEESLPTLEVQAVADLSPAAALPAVDDANPPPIPIFDPAPIPAANATSTPATHATSTSAASISLPVHPAVQVYDDHPDMRDPKKRTEHDEDTITHNHTWRNKETAERRRSISPNSKDPEEARKQIASGINKIKAGTCDDYGYRKLQGLIQFHDEIFQDEQKYDEMLLALLSAIEKRTVDRRQPLGRRHDNKFQILVTIRLMFSHNQKYFAAYFPRAMAALLLSRRNFEARHHIVSGLEETAQDIVGKCNPSDVIDAVLDVLETEERDDTGNRIIAMGLHILCGLSARTRALNASLDSQQEIRMGQFGLKCLREPNSIVRKAVIEYCLELRRIIKPEPRFFRLVTGDIEDLKNLITYYAANRNQ